MTKRRCILIIEDDHDTRVAMRLVMEEKGFLILSATNGIEALDILAHDHMKPDLILLDMMMPLMDGEIFLKTRNLNSRIAKIPLIIVTAFMEKIPPAYKQSFIIKPFDFESLLAKIDETLASEADPAL